VELHVRADVRQRYGEVITRLIEMAGALFGRAR
jgi:hypothetical protein